MSVLAEVKETIIEAKKKYNKEKYIIVLEEQIEKLQQEIGRLNTKLNLLESNEFILNSDHLELFELFRKNNYKCYETDIKSYVKNNIDLEIALSELLDNNYFEYPKVLAIGGPVKLLIPENKKLKFLQALKSKNN